MDWIAFDVNTIFIDEVRGKGLHSELALATGERIECREEAARVMKMIVDAKFGGAI